MGYDEILPGEEYPTHGHADGYYFNPKKGRTLNEYQLLYIEQGVSYSTFRKFFKEFTGLSPALYQQDLRLQRAKELLATTDLSIKEIAYRLCFDTPDYFSQKFKAKTGMTPREYRQG